MYSSKLGPTCTTGTNPSREYARFIAIVRIEQSRSDGRHRGRGQSSVVVIGHQSGRADATQRLNPAGGKVSDLRTSAAAPLSRETSVAGLCAEKSVKAVSAARRLRAGCARKSEYETITACGAAEGSKAPWRPRPSAGGSDEAGDDEQWRLRGA